jgi:hypothetical protein
LSKLNQNKSENIVLKFPQSGGKQLELELVRVYFLPPDFKIKASSGKSIDYKGGLYYQGLITGDENSLAAISIFENEVIGIISNSEGNFNLGSLTDNNGMNTNEYIYYNENDLMKRQSFECGVGEGNTELNRSNNRINVNTPDHPSTTSPVRMYYVCDYQMYLDKGSNTTNVGNYVTAVFNQVNLLYQNESIPLVISSIDVYTAPDPYLTFTTDQTFEILKAFGTDTKNGFVGDLAQLLSTRTPITGAIAWVNVLCQSYEPGSESGRYAFCEIENTYQNVPVFSWTVEVMAHETGHNFGSMHTHACVWPVYPGGGIGAIDSCYDSEGGCFLGTHVIFNGTIMSYCHIGGAINFNLGFGALPGDTIRKGYEDALCIDNPLNSSELPVAYSLLQNYPNPFNPSTSIKFALPEAGLVTLRIYDITGREVTALVNNKFYDVGIFSLTLDAGKYRLASGVYLYRLEVNRDNRSVYTEIKKMVLVK